MVTITQKMGETEVYSFNVPKLYMKWYNIL